MERFTDKQGLKLFGAPQIENEEMAIVLNYKEGTWSIL
jgi:hypothetical protein